MLQNGIIYITKFYLCFNYSFLFCDSFRTLCMHRPQIFYGSVLLMSVCRFW